MNKIKIIAVTSATALMLSFGISAMAYDGTNCEAKGMCWEAKPSFPDKIQGTKFDPKHSKKELEKQTTSMSALDDRNAKRAANFKKTGKWVY